MPSLLDIGALAEKVDIRGVQVAVYGISAEGFVQLLNAFPDLRRLMSGQEDFKAEDLMKQLPAAVASVIAAGTGHPGEADHIATAGTLAVGDQVALLALIWKLTFPKGVASFIEALERLAGDVGAASGWAQVTKSPGPLPNSSSLDIPLGQPGPTPPGA